MADNEITKKEKPDGAQFRKPTRDEVKLLYLIMGGIILVLFLAVIGFAITSTQTRIDSETNKQATYQSLRDQVKEQNDKIDALTKAVQDEQKTIQKTR